MVLEPTALFEMKKNEINFEMFYLWILDLFKE